MITQEQILRSLYNLILNSGTREYERSLLEKTKDALESGKRLNDELADLEVKLRPLAVRNNLTPDVADFYAVLTHQSDTLPEAKEPVGLATAQNQERAIFAGGCFWCTVEPFEEKAGVISVLSGYIGGHVDHPTYDQVCSGATGHVEAVEIVFDPQQISYQELVEIFWGVTDPTDAFGQFQDRGSQYKSVIFVTSDEQAQIAKASKAELQKTYSAPLVTEIRPASTFWPAESYHQQFYKKNPRRYRQVERGREQLQSYLNLRRKLHHFRDKGEKE